MKFLVCDLSLIDKSHLITDKYISYEDGDYKWNASHAPISWHSYAAAMHGRFVSAPNDNWTEHVKWADVILFTFTYNCKLAKDIIQLAKQKGKIVLGAFHENGDLFQKLAKENIEWLLEFKECINVCDYILIQSEHALRPCYLSLGIEPHRLVNIPQPYDIEYYKKFHKTDDEKKGVFIGSRLKVDEFEKRNTILSLLHAIDYVKTNNDIKKSITFQLTVADGASKLESYKSTLQKIAPDIEFNLFGLVSYPELLEKISLCECTINLDAADTQGQIDYDSMLVGTPIEIVPNLESEYGTDAVHRLIKFQDARKRVTHLHPTLNSNMSLHEHFLKFYHSMEVCKERITKLVGL